MYIAVMKEDIFIFIKNWMWKDQPHLTEKEVDEKVQIFINSNLEEMEGLDYSGTDSCENCG
jgi:hypothetical protein